MARQIIFHKYQGTENGFLIYDIRKNGGEMNDGLLHMIRSRNFGLDLDGILVGPYLVDGSLEMKMFDRQGHEVSEKREYRCTDLLYERSRLSPGRMSADGAETGKDILLVLKPGNR